MPIINIIAGPPGIGKTSNAKNFINSEFEILNTDRIYSTYKEMGMANYQTQALNSFAKTVNLNMSLNLDIAIELNMGNEFQYSYLKLLTDQFPHYIINLFLFYTDNINICFQGNESRYERGFHFVELDVIEYMYSGVLHFYKSNFMKFDSALFIDVKEKHLLTVVGQFQKKPSKLTLLRSNENLWFNNDLRQFLISKTI